MLETIKQLTNKPALKVLLCCTGGLTTGYFADRINQITKLLNIDVQVSAVSYNNLYKASEDYDMIMLAPQISYMYAKVCEILKNKIVLNIPPAIFAKYDVKEILNLVDQELIKNVTKMVKFNCFRLEIKPSPFIVKFYVFLFLEIVIGFILHIELYQSQSDY
mgnify:CR=1 FL=1